MSIKVAILKWNSKRFDFNHISGYELNEIKQLLNRDSNVHAELVGFEGSDRRLENTNLNDYDRIYLVNGPVISDLETNFMMPEHLTKLIEALDKCMSEKYFIFTDTALAPDLKNGNKLGGQWTILTQCQDTEATKEYLSEYFSCIKDIMYVPFEKMEFEFRGKVDDDVIHDASTEEFDLFYGGSNRYGNRRHKLSEFYGKASKNMKVGMCGSISENDIDFTQEQEQIDSVNVSDNAGISFLGRKTADEYNDLMFHSFATVALFDPIHAELGCVTQRVAECVRNKVIAFYDNDFPVQIFPNKTIDNFLRVKNYGDFLSKFNAIKQDYYLRAIVLAEQDRYNDNKIKLI